MSDSLNSEEQINMQEDENENNMQEDVTNNMKRA